MSNGFQIIVRFAGIGTGDGLSSGSAVASPLNP